MVNKDEGQCNTIKVQYESSEQSNLRHDVINQMYPTFLEPSSLFSQLLIAYMFVFKGILFKFDQNDIEDSFYHN